MEGLNRLLFRGGRSLKIWIKIRVKLSASTCPISGIFGRQKEGPSPTQVHSHVMSQLTDLNADTFKNIVELSLLKKIFGFSREKDRALAKRVPRRLRPPAFGSTFLKISTRLLWHRNTILYPLFALLFRKFHVLEASSRTLLKSGYDHEKVQMLISQKYYGKQIFYNMQMNFTECDIFLHFSLCRQLANPRLPGLPWVVWPGSSCPIQLPTNLWTLWKSTCPYTYYSR